MTLERLVEFHRRRVQVLAAAGPDILAFETIPSLLEAQVGLPLVHPWYNPYQCMKSTVCECPQHVSAWSWTPPAHQGRTWGTRAKSRTPAPWPESLRSSESLRISQNLSESLRSSWGGTEISSDQAGRGLVLQQSSVHYSAVKYSQQPGRKQ